MPYNIKHKSKNECLIEYKNVHIRRPRKRLNLPLVVFAIFALLIGIDFIFVIIGFFILSALLRKTPSSKKCPDYEIEFKKSENRLSIRNQSQSNPKSKSYPLSHFLGFGFYETPAGSKNEAQADLFLKMVPGKGLSKRMPIREYRHPVSLNNAKVIIDETNEWLGIQDEIEMAESVGKPDSITSEEEIFRDFRDME